MNPSSSSSLSPSSSSSSLPPLSYIDMMAISYTIPLSSSSDSPPSPSSSLSPSPLIITLHGGTQSFWIPEHRFVSSITSLFSNSSSPTKMYSISLPCHSLDLSFISRFFLRDGSKIYQLSESHQNKWRGKIEAFEQGPIHNPFSGKRDLYSFNNNNKNKNDNNNRDKDGPTYLPSIPYILSSLHDLFTTIFNDELSSSSPSSSYSPRPILFLCYSAGAMLLLKYFTSSLYRSSSFLRNAFSHPFSRCIAIGCPLLLCPSAVFGIRSYHTKKSFSDAGLWQRMIKTVDVASIVSGVGTWTAYNDGTFVLTEEERNLIVQNNLNYFNKNINNNNNNNSMSPLPLSFPCIHFISSLSDQAFPARPCLLSPLSPYPEFISNYIYLMDCDHFQYFIEGWNQVKRAIIQIFIKENMIHSISIPNINEWISGSKKKSLIRTQVNNGEQGGKQIEKNETTKKHQSKL